MKNLLIPFCLALAACGHHHGHPTPRPAEPRPVSILVEVYDPVTNLVWEGVSVRVVEAWHEWSGCTCMSPFVDWFETDINGRGVINVLAADQLLNSPRLYATFLLWMMSELFEELPEVGDPEKPKFVFFFDCL